MLSEDLEITTKQLRYWASSGYLTRNGQSIHPGRGGEFSSLLVDDDLVHLKYMSELVELGFYPAEASKIAWQLVDCPHTKLVGLGDRYSLQRHGGA